MSKIDKNKCISFFYKSRILNRLGLYEKAIKNSNNYE